MDGTWVDISCCLRERQQEEKFLLAKSSFLIYVPYLLLA